MDSNAQPGEVNVSDHSSDGFNFKEWPGAFGIYKFSRKAVMLNIGAIAGFIVLNIVAGFVLRYIPILGQLISILLGIFIDFCLMHLYLAGINGKTLSFNDAINKTMKLYVEGVLLYILMGLTCLSFLLLIVPGLIIVPRIVLAPYFMIDKNLSAIDAYKASWHATKGHVGKLYGLLGVGILIALPIITIIGILLTIYWGVMYSAAPAFLYRHIVHQPKTQ